jgi:hypothetical protein
MFQSVEELSQKHSETGYFIDPTMTKVVFLADQMKKPLLLEGPAGSGKTEIGRTLANESGLGFLAATTADVKSQLSRSEWQPGQAALRACTSQRTGHPVPRRTGHHCARTHGWQRSPDR